MGWTVRNSDGAPIGVALPDPLVIGAVEASDYIALPNGGNAFLGSALATSDAQAQNPGAVEFTGHYWDGAASQIIFGQVRLAVGDTLDASGDPASFSIDLMNIGKFYWVADSDNFGADAKWIFSPNSLMEIGYSNQSGIGALHAYLPAADPGDNGMWVNAANHNAVTIGSGA